MWWCLTGFWKEKGETGGVKKNNLKAFFQRELPGCIQPSHLALHTCRVYERLNLSLRSTSHFESYPSHHKTIAVTEIWGVGEWGDFLMCAPVHPRPACLHLQLILHLNLLSHPYPPTAEESAAAVEARGEIRCVDGDLKHQDQIKSGTCLLRDIFLADGNDSFAV